MTTQDNSDLSRGGILEQLIKLDDHDKMGLKTFEYTEHKPQDIENDIDPDNNFLNNINNNCCYYSDEQFNATVKIDHNFSIIHFNSRSLYANFKKITKYLEQFKKPFNIIAISETWITSEKGVDDLQMNGYELNYMCRKNKAGGGVALYVDIRLDYKVVECMSAVVDDITECITVEIGMEKKKNVLVSCIYRTPGTSIDTFGDWMEKMFASTNQKVMFICGDINVDLLNPNKHKSTEEFINTIYSLGLHPKITKPSRITAQSATLIDNILTNVLEDKIVSGLLVNDISDHLPVFAVYDCSHKENKDSNKFIYKRARNEGSMTLFRNELLKQNWNEVYGVEDIDIAYESFLKTFNTLYDKHCPMKRYNRKQKYNDSPWLTKGLQNACKKKNSLYRDFIKHRNTETENKYKKYKNKLTNIMRTCKKDYYNKLLEHNKGNTKGLWSVLNTIIRSGSRVSSYPAHFKDEDKTLHNMDEVVSGFNKFFVNVGPELANQIHSETSGEVSVPNFERNPSSFFLRATEEGEIKEIVNKFKNKISTDCEEIDMTIVKRVIDGILKPLTHICNLSFLTGKFPDKMKVAKVIPLYKTGDKHNFTNYRPVSLLPQFSKILEKLFNTRLDTFIEKHKLLTDSQYGFRENRSTSLALMELIEEITNCVDNKKYAIGIFIDLKKAFDTINHDILLEKMERYGMRGVGLNWLKSYLLGRQQFVKLGEHKSTLLDITCGVPQGSILGPKLFILYINDICKVSNILKFVLFADDTNIFCSGDNLQLLLEEITSEMNKLKRWFDRNKLSLNLSKTKIMFFGNHKIKANSTVKIDNVNIERVYEIKFLGVILDHKISWKPHISYVRAKMARSVSILGKSRFILNQRALHILYCSLVLPYLNYCLEIWGNTYKSNLKPLVITQKRAIRIVNNAGYQEHTNSLFLQLNALKFMDMVNFKTAQVMFKARNRLLPVNIQNMFFDREGGYNLRGQLNFRKLLVHTTMKSKCITICGVNLWQGCPKGRS